MAKSYGIKVSKEGEDVLTGADSDMLISSKFPMFKIKTRGTGSVRMGKTAIADGGDGITTSQTTIGVTSTANFPSSGYFWVVRTVWEAVAYTGKTANSFTGCTRGYLGTGPVAALEGADVVNGIATVAVAHGLAYPPVIFVYMTDTWNVLCPVALSEFAFNYADACVDTTNLTFGIKFTDFNAEYYEVGTYTDYNFIYFIMHDSITTPYY